MCSCVRDPGCVWVRCCCCCFESLFSQCCCCRRRCCCCCCYQIDGTVLLLQEIYGLDGVARTQPGINMDDDDDDNDDDDADGFSSTSQTGMECELCLSEPRDTMILPCRHLSICSSCGMLRCCIRFVHVCVCVLSCVGGSAMCKCSHAC